MYIFNTFWYTLVLMPNPEVRKSEAEFEMKPESIAVVLTTSYPHWYPGEIRSVSDTDKVRGNLALDSIAAGVKNGFRVVVGDVYSSSEFLDELTKYPEITFFIREEEARGAGRRQGYLIASALEGVKGILRPEAEKASIVSDFAPQIMAPILRGEADIVAPKRNDGIWRLTHPEYMWKSEMRANKKYNQILHQMCLLPKDISLEWFFGPVAFANTPEVLGLFMEKYEFASLSKYEARISPAPEDWSNSMLFPVVKALYLGLRVLSVEVPFEYPPTQRENEETAISGSVEKFLDKRNKQRLMIVTELIHLIRHLQASPKNRLVRVYPTKPSSS